VIRIFWKVIQKRRSRRVYRNTEAFTIGALSGLLRATQGITENYGKTQFRTAPLAVGFFSIETYLKIRLIEGLEKGVYHFRPGKFDLEFLKKGEFSKLLAEAAFSQRIVATARATFICTTVLARSKWKYCQRTYRSIYLDADISARTSA
jgi:SagB-type dehydrogenase family enzyme